MLKDQDTAGRVVAAICAAPMALAAHGIGKGKNVTIYPSMENHLVNTYFSPFFTLETVAV